MTEGELEGKRRQLKEAQKTLGMLQVKAVGHPELERPTVLTRDLARQETIVAQLKADIAQLEQEVTVPEPPEPPEPSQAREKAFSELNFTNRQNELKRLMDPRGTATYLVIDAPGQYGKTFLVEALKDLYEVEPSQWRCILHSVSASDTPVSLLRSIYEKISVSQSIPIRELLDADAEGINRLAVRIIESVPENTGESWGITLIFDGLEKLKEPYSPRALEPAVWLLGTLIPELSDQLERSGFLQDRYLKFIFSGRYIANMVKSRAGHLPISVETLEPFNWHAVQSLVEREVRELGFSPREPDIARHTAQLMYHTGGPPGYLVSLLSEVVNSRFTLDPERFYQERIDTFYRRHISETIENIREEIRAVGGEVGDQLVSAMDTLSVFRRFDAAIIEELIQLEELVWPRSPWDLIMTIGPLHMLTLDRGYYRDAIARKLLTIRLRQQNPKQLKRVCRIASGLYGRRLSSEHRSKEPVLLFAEWLYQEAQLAAIDPDKRAELHSLLCSKNIEDQICKVVSNLDEFEDPVERLYSLLNEVVADSELKSLLDFALGPQVSGVRFDPMSTLTRAIENVVQETRGKCR